MMEHERQKSNAIREWIIFSLSLGLGAHIVLGIMLHSPDLWETKSLWINGLLISFSVYIVVQLSRSLWRFIRSHSNSEPAPPPEDE
jgi:hypothetical protein